MSIKTFLAFMCIALVAFAAGGVGKAWLNSNKLLAEEIRGQDVDSVMKDEMVKKANEIVEKAEYEKLFHDFVYFINPNISIKDYKVLKASIEKHAPETNLSAIEFLALCAHESRLDKKAFSPTGDYGMCQINIKTYKILIGHKNIDKQKLLEIDTNIMLASKLLKENMVQINQVFGKETEEFKKLVLISSYNMGLLPAMKLAKNGNALSKYASKVLVVYQNGTEKSNGHVQ